MRVVTPEQAEHIPAQPHRGGGVDFRHLLHGDEGAPDNYSLSLVDVAERYHTPQHRHNFEQVRVMLAGRFGFGADAVQERGSVGYFCEGTYYSQHGEEPSTTLLLQVGGASGAGYMSFAQLRAGIARLESRGSFRDGIYTWIDESGARHNNDGYEAVWEQVNGRAITYPKPRYLGPVILDPDRFGWVDAPRAPGVAIRHLGTFNERGLAIAQWRIAPGARWPIEAEPHRRAFFVQRGGLDLGGTGSAFELLRGEAAERHAGDDGAEGYAFRMPRFD